MVFKPLTLPLITIGITAYNAQDSIERAIKSALSQTYPHIKIVIVDDASTDDTAKICENFAQENANIHFFNNEENLGVAGTRNRIIDEASGEFICFFDDDDESLPERVQAQYEHIISYEKAFANGMPVICHTARLQIHPDGKNHNETTVGTNLNHIAPNGKAFAQRILMGRPVAHGHGSTATCSQMARTEIYRNYRFDNDFTRAEDTDFNVRLALAGAHFPGISKPLVKQNMSYGTEKTLQKEYEMTLQLYDKHKSFIEAKDNYDFVCKWLDVKYEYLKGHKSTFVNSLFKIFMKYPIRSFQRLVWASPSLRLNMRQSKFHINMTQDN